MSVPFLLSHFLKFSISKCVAISGKSFWSFCELCNFSVLLSLMLRVIFKSSQNMLLNYSNLEIVVSVK